MTHPNLCTIENSLLVIVDIQPRLLATMPPADGERMMACSSRLLKAAGMLSVPVFVTEQYPKGLGSTEERLKTDLPNNAHKFEKTGFSCCTATGFLRTLEQTGRKQLILVGQETHVCILQTTLDLIHLGYQIQVVEDAVCSRNTQHKNSALHRMQAQGATLTLHESVLFEWLKDSTHPDFKEISGLVK